MHLTGSYIISLWKPSGVRKFQKYAHNKVILGTLSHGRLTISSKNSQKNHNKRKDRQLAGQSYSTPFMNIKDGYNGKATFGMQDRLDDKIDKLTLMMSKLTAQGNNQNKQFKPKICQGKWRGQS